MIRLSLLGGADLARPDGWRILPVLQQPKRLAVLAYLALAGPGIFRQRDELLVLFWPEAKPDRARQALSASIHFLRQHLGSDAIVRRASGELGVSAAHVLCDVVEFRQLAAQDPERALGLYRGEFLPAFFIGAGPEFEQWLDDERHRLRNQACDAAQQLAEAAEQRGDVEVALGWARQRLDLSGHDETAVRRVMSLMGRLGDRSGALDVYERFTRRLNVEYEGARSPAPETRALADRLLTLSLSIGQAAHAPLAVAASDAATQRRNPLGLNAGDDTLPLISAPATSAIGTPNLWRRINRSRTRVSQISIGTIVTAATLWLSAYRFTRSVTPATATRSSRVAVVALTPEDSSNSTAEIAAALTSTLTDRLVRVPSLDIISVGRVPSRTDSVERANLQSADFAVTGSVIRSGAQIRVDIQIADPRSGTALRTAEFDAPTANILPFTDTLSGQVEGLVQHTIGRQVHLRQLRQSIRDDRLFALMQDADDDQERASDLARAGNIPASIRALASADTTIGRVETAAPASSAVVLARSTVLKALALTYLAAPNRQSAPINTLLERSVAEATRAAAMSDTSAAAAEALGSVAYIYSSLVSLPRDSARTVMLQADRSLRRAVALDPRRSGAWTLLGALRYARADFSGAYVAAEHAYDADAYGEHSQENLSRLFLVAHEIGDDSAATRWCGQLTQRFSESWTASYCQLSILAWMPWRTAPSIPDVWRLAFNGAGAHDATPLIEPRLDMIAADILARTGLRDSALAVIRRARAQGIGDPELAPFEAEALAELGNLSAARRELQEYVAKAPDRRAGVFQSRRFAELRGN